MKEVLTLQQVNKTYGYGFNQVHALKDITLSINEGEYVAIVGTSGSGKSTLLHILGGLAKPTKGKVYLEDQDMYDLHDKELTILRRRRIGFVFQFFNLVPTLNVYENIVLAIHLDGLQEDKEYIDEIITLLGLHEKKYCYIDELSGGQQQRVAIARALANKPAIILADEPTGNLDSKNSSEVLDILKMTQRKYHQTIVIATHEQTLTNKADRIIKLDDGKIVSKEDV